MKDIWNRFSHLQVECTYLKQIRGRLHSLENIISKVIRPPNCTIGMCFLGLAHISNTTPWVILTYFFFSSTHYMKMERTSSSLQPRHSEIPIKAVSILYQPRRKHRIKLVHFLLIQGMILSVYLLFFFF